MEPLLALLGVIVALILGRRYLKSHQAPAINEVWELNEKDKVKWSRYDDLRLLKVNFDRRLEPVQVDVDLVEQQGYSISVDIWTVAVK